MFLDSVVSIDWNKDGTLLASADMAGLIKIWNIKEKKSIMDLEEDELEFISFHPALDKKGNSYLLAAQTDGNCYFYSIKDGSFQVRLILILYPFSISQGVDVSMYQSDKRFWPDLLV